MGFWGSKALLSAVELGLFTELAEALDAKTLAERLGLHSRSTRDFSDALVALHMLERRGDRRKISVAKVPNLRRCWSRSRRIASTGSPGPQPPLWRRVRFAGRCPNL